MSSACNQIEVFARILKTSLTSYISQRNENESIVKEIAVSRFACLYLFQATNFW